MGLVAVIRFTSPVRSCAHGVTTSGGVSKKVLCVRLAYQAKHESLEAEHNPKVGYRKPGG